MPPLHWIVYVSCATTGTAAIGLLIAADMTRQPELGHWGIVTALLAALLACVVVCDRFARRVTTDITHQTARHAARNEELMRTLSVEVTENCNNQTRKIADETSDAILQMVGDGPRRVR